MPAVDTSLFSVASSSEQMAAAAAGAKTLAVNTFPFWGTAAALILLTVIIGVVIYSLRLSKNAAPKAR